MSHLSKVGIWSIRRAASWLPLGGLGPTLYKKGTGWVQTCFLSVGVKCPTASCPWV